MVSKKKVKSKVRTSEAMLKAEVVTNEPQRLRVAVLTSLQYPPSMIGFQTIIRIVTLTNMEKQNL